MLGSLPPEVTPSISILILTPTLLSFCILLETVEMHVTSECPALSFPLCSLLLPWVLPHYSYSLQKTNKW
nr:hypothetical protein Itr_chr15CG10760 [Ipomoea trifida]